MNAWVDEGVVPLVNAMNRLSNVITLDSCEGHGDEPAFVRFVHRTGHLAPSHTPKLAQRIAQHLAETECTASYCVSVSWEGAAVTASVEVPKTCLKELCEALQGLER